MVKLKAETICSSLFDSHEVILGVLKKTICEKNPNGTRDTAPPLKGKSHEKFPLFWDPFH